MFIDHSIGSIGIRSTMMILLFYCCKLNTYSSYLFALLQQNFIYWRSFVVQGPDIIWTILWGKTSIEEFKLVKFNHSIWREKYLFHSPHSTVFKHAQTVYDLLVELKQNGVGSTRCVLLNQRYLKSIHILPIFFWNLLYCEWWYGSMGFFKSIDDYIFSVKVKQTQTVVTRSTESDSQGGKNPRIFTSTGTESWIGYNF